MKNSYFKLILFLLVSLLLALPLGTLYAAKPPSSPPSDAWSLSIGRDASHLARTRSKVKPPKSPPLNYPVLRRAVLAQGSNSEYDPFPIDPTLKGMENYNQASTPAAASSGKR